MSSRRHNRADWWAVATLVAALIALPFFADKADAQTGPCESYVVNDPGFWAWADFAYIELGFSDGTTGTFVDVAEGTYLPAPDGETVVSLTKCDFPPAVATATPAPTASPSPTEPPAPTPEPTSTPEPTPVATATPAPTATPEPEPSPTPPPQATTPTPEATPTEPAEPTPTPEPTEPPATSTPEPTPTTSAPPPQPRLPETGADAGLLGLLAVAGVSLIVTGFVLRRSPRDHELGR